VLLSKSPDQGNNLVLAEQRIKEYLHTIIPSRVEQTKALTRLDTALADEIKDDPATAKFLSAVREYIGHLQSTLSSDE
jgi:hypothetical protein